MKRIREFKVIISSASGDVEYAITGWHKAWDFVLANLDEPNSIGCIYDAERKGSAVIARFSARDSNVESDDRVAKKPAVSWRSETVRTRSGQTRYALSNATDFGWNWVEGSKRELPFRLSYFERDIEQNPGGVIARLIEMGAGARDLLRRT